MAKKKILIVDDETSITDMLKISLAKAGGFDVRVENKGADALKAARDFKPDLIFLDVMMPDLDGGEVANRIKADPAVSGTPVVFMTAAVTKDEVDSQANTIGGYPFLAKPVSLQEIVACIRKFAR